MTTPFQYEQDLIRYVLAFGNDAANICVQQVTPDKFIFNTTGEFGSDHRYIWAVIRELYLNRNISPNLNYVTGSGGVFSDNCLFDYVHSLILPTYLDVQLVLQLSNQIDKQGIVYNVAQDSRLLGNSVDSVEAFLQQLNGVQDVQAWATDSLKRIRNIVNSQTGYSHISDIAEDVRDKWDRIYTGKETPVLECGIPILAQHKLFPRGEIAVIHGLSGSGKSSFVFQVNVGTAINLYLNDAAGCVAINSLEMSGMNLVERVAGILAHVDVSKWKTNDISPLEYDKLLEWLDFASVLPIFIDDTSFLTTSALEYRAGGLHISEHGPVVQLSSDYGELFADDSPGSEEQRINKVFRTQFHLSREIGASIIAISQSTHNKQDTGHTYIAGADGTRYSRGVLQSADMLLELWNPPQIEKSGRLIKLPDNSPVTKDHPYLLLQKYRGADMGDAIPLGWVAEHTTFFDKGLNQTIGKEIVYTHLQDAVNKFKGGGSW